MGRTETQKDNLNPNYKTSFTVDYYFETRQDCKFEVKDDDDGSSEKIGHIETTIGKLMVFRILAFLTSRAHPSRPQ